LNEMSTRALPSEDPWVGPSEVEEREKDEQERARSRQYRTSARTFLQNVKGMHWRDFGIVAAFHLSSIFAMTYAMNYVHDGTPDTAVHPALPDVIHKAIPFDQHDPRAHQLQSFCDTSLAILSITIIGAGFYHFKFNTWLVACRWLSTWAVCCWIRIPFMLVTPLPATDDLRCRYGPKRAIQSYLGNAFIGLVSFGSKNIHCGDLLFSGHTIFMGSLWVCCLCHLRQYRVLCLFVSVLCLTNLVLFVVLRNHYTVDVLLAMYVVVTVFMCLPVGRPPFLYLHFWPALWAKIVKAVTNPSDVQLVLPAPYSMMNPMQQMGQRSSPDSNHSP